MTKQIESATKPSTRHRLQGIDQFSAIHQQLSDEYGIGTSFIGHRVKNGRTTRQICIVCCVRKKRAMRTHDQDRIHKLFHYVHLDCDHTMKTDIIEIRKPFKYQSRYNPGDRISAQSVFATIGAFAKHLSIGRVFITAGHFASDVGGTGTTVTIKDRQSRSNVISGTIVKSKLKGSIDYAIVKPDVSISAHVGNQPLSIIYQPTLSSDLGK